VTFSVWILSPHLGPNVTIFEVIFSNFFKTVHGLKISFTQVSWVLSFSLKSSKWLKLFHENALLEKSFESSLVLFYKVFFAIVYKHFFTSKWLCYIKTDFFLTMYKVENIQELLKSQQKVSSVHHGVSIKELICTWKIEKYETVHVFLWLRLISFQQCIAYTVRSWEHFNFFFLFWLLMI
jgi:hypothetical protein